MSDLHSGSGGGGQPPRGILKNRDGNSRFSSGPPPPEMSSGDPRLNRRRDSAGSMDSGWMNPIPGGGVGLALAPGVNPSPPVMPMDNNGGFERSLHQKLNEFISRKNDMLFKPLTGDEMPLAEVKGFQHSSEDHYGLVPSLDHFLRVDADEIRRYFFQNLQVGDILIASVYSKNNSGLNLKLLSTDGGKHVVLEDLGIKAFCPSSQTVAAKEKNYEFEIGDSVRVEVLEVVADLEKLVCGMKGATLSPEMQHTFHLGSISRHDFPLQFSLAKNDSESRRRRTYEEMLINSNGFQNPNNIGHLASTMGILSNRNSLMIGLRNEFPGKECASYLRRIQNGKWAHGNVADGIKYFKLGKFTEAFQCLNKALSIDAENVEGLVARGALYANNRGYEKAIEDFEAALKFNPNHYNARKYLAETLVALGKQQETTTGKFEDAVASYSKCLVVKPDHKEAKEALWSLYKVDISKLVAAVGPTKAVEIKDKLKAILQTDLGINVDGKSGGKDKKSKRKKGRKSSGSEEDSSSSTTSDSDSDSDSSDESEKGKKRKKSKKKKKKSKKSKKSRDEPKMMRALSLSPFSKRLVDPHGQGASGSGLAGFNESSFAEWGQQLGLKQEVHDVHDSDDESKRSRKKSKDKKRSKKKDKSKKRKRNTSSSSTSESDSSKEKRKSKHSSANTSSQNLGNNITIPDLGDLEAKLSAYYSKIEQVKLVPTIPPESVKITVERNSGSNQYSRGDRDAYNEPHRKIEVKPHVDSKHDLYNTGGWQDGKPMGKIKLQTDDYGNYIQPENIVRTVHNDTILTDKVPPTENKPIKFEMKFKQNPAVPPQSAESDQGSGSKWRPLGSAPPPGSSEDDPKSNKSSPVKPAIRNPFEVKKFDQDKGNVDQQDRKYRGRKSISPSPRGRRDRKRSSSGSSSSSYSSRSRSRSRSRNRSRSPGFRGGRGRYNDRGDRRPMRYGDRDFRDNRDRRDNRDFRGRGGVRFFRGYNRPVGGRPFISRPRGRRDYRPNGPRDSKFRNRFSRSPSGGSRSRSRSRSRNRRSASRSKSKSKSKSVERTHADKDKQKEPQRGSAEVETKNRGKSGDVGLKNNENGTVHGEIQIGGLTTTKASDVEELLDKRNAEKKEELRKSNPEFFRT